jgi:hypothetical protein
MEKRLPWALRWLAVDIKPKESVCFYEIRFIPCFTLEQKT